MTILDFRGRDTREEEEQRWLLRAVHSWLQDKHVQRRIFRFKILTKVQYFVLGAAIERCFLQRTVFSGDELKVWHRRVCAVVSNREVRRAIQRCLLARQVNQYLAAKADPSKELLAPQKKSEIMRELLELHESMSEKVRQDESLIVAPGAVIH